jgi:Zinc finger, C3HC4 type (RING finger)
LLHLKHLKALTILSSNSSREYQVIPNPLIDVWLCNEDDSEAIGQLAITRGIVRARLEYPSQAMGASAAGSSAPRSPIDPKYARKDSRSLSPSSSRSAKRLKLDPGTPEPEDHIEEDNCIICLQSIIDRTVLACAHDAFCFECMVVWTSKHTPLFSIVPIQLHWLRRCLMLRSTVRSVQEMSIMLRRYRAISHTSCSFRARLPETFFGTLAVFPRPCPSIK